MEFRWETRYVPSWLALKEKGRRAVVVRVHPDALLGSKFARLYDAYANDEKVYSAADHWKVGQEIDLPR